ncbi:GNAT family protein [Ferrovibrio sp.]|uniref:GNAT family N-acetyltransferase n=1 Tax=Ferrovibrio sp. TaxID=1917215 RepID=UPI0025B9AAFD|nr:GNAT family protein [Ferrovibrio sp.]MBX3456253.1 GNAT family N-acetyltransferase [Ferrovibrio sp.]
MAQDGFFLSGNKAALRALRHDDLVALGRWWDDAEVTHLLEMGARPSRDKELEAFWRLAAESDDNVVFAICDPENGRLLGTCGLYAISWVCRRAQFNILIGEKNAWDKGVGSDAARIILDYAFAKLNLESVQLGVNAENKRAIASYRKVGYVHEGTRRRFVYRNGRYYDIEVFSVLRDEYKPMGNS